MTDARGQLRSSPTPPPSSRFGWVEGGLLVALAVLWGVAYLFIRQGILLGASPLPFASVRYLLSAAAFGAIAWARRESLPSRRSLLISAGVGGVLIIGLYGGLLYWGEQYTTGGYAAILSATAPLLTVGAAFFLLPDERLTRESALGLGLGFVGVTVLAAPTLSGGAVGVWPGPAFVVGAFLTTAVGTVLLRRFRTGPQSLGQIGVQFAVAGAMLAVASWVVPGPRALPLTGGVLASLAALVVFSSLMGYFVYFRLHHTVGPIRANVVAYLIPLVGIGIGTGILGEPASAWEVAGFVIVAAGVTLLLYAMNAARSASGTRPR